MSVRVSAARHAVPLGPRRWILLGAIGAAALLVTGRGVQLQAVQGTRWAAEANRQHQDRAPIPARRGRIFDRNGVPLALSYETYRVAVAPQEIVDLAAASAALQHSAGLSQRAAARATDRRRRWVVLPGRFTIEQKAALQVIPGIHIERRLERFYPQGDIGREVLGMLSGDGRPLGGIEQEMDEMLRGSDGFRVAQRDADGLLYPSISLRGSPPRDGSDVYLTIDFHLQEIADGALRAAVDNTGARGGDLLISAPATGEILAAVSRRASGTRTLGAVTEPYEPGSTLKPLFVAALLATGKAGLGDEVFAENGAWTDPHGRTVRDVHPYGTLTFRDALRVSSNVAMAKFAPRLAPGDQFSSLRDFGLGTLTGIEYPSEAAGRLRPPTEWSNMTQTSLAIGYEISVTPLQLLMAYGALANGGLLMEPRLVRELRSVSGVALRHWRPRTLRQAVPPEIAEQIRGVLASVVDDGTAARASLATFAVAGKTGTARVTGAGGRYEAGSYAATFVGFFPAEDPQLALFVKLDRPQGAYYGGLTAAPVMRETLQAILAARARSLDATSLLMARRAETRRLPEGRGSRLPDGGESPYVFVFGEAPSSFAEDASRPNTRVPVPALQGLAVREAIRRAHAVGLRVRVEGFGRIRGTHPVAGSPLFAGDTLLLLGDPR
ncbi:MAG: penicillin-binding transpeptidase domain-containing protein [Gemmatimonadota bacterium]|nr:penicillin-binding transpeptidase domain-containing protein [Gemmatimonadota bacterium]